MVFRKRERRPLKRGGGETEDEGPPPLTTVRTLDDTLLMAIDRGDVESVKKIIEENPSLDLNKEIYNWGGHTFLTFTISREGDNKDKIVKLLLEKGADPHVTYQGNFSPLYDALTKRPTDMTREIVRILQENPYKKAHPKIIEPLSYNNTITGGKIRTRRRKMKNSCKKRKTRTRKSKKIKK